MLMKNSFDLSLEKIFWAFTWALIQLEVMIVKEGCFTGILFGL